MPSPSEEIARLAAEMEQLAGPSGSAPLPPGSSPADSPQRNVPSGYAAVTKTATYGFLASLPLFLLYEAGILLANSGQLLEVRVGADIWLKTLLATIGGTGWAALGAAVLMIGGVIWWSERKNRPPIVARYFGFIVGESLLYAVVLAFLVGGAIGALFGGWILPDAALAQLAQMGLGMKLALSIGAGLYEELVFRVLLVGGLFLLLNRVFGADRNRAYLIAAVVGAAIFSAVHHIGPMGDPFTLQVFSFRFLFGLALNGVFLLRGFAVAAWTHALYDVLVVTGSLG